MSHPLEQFDYLDTFVHLDRCLIFPKRTPPPYSPSRSPGVSVRDHMFSWTGQFNAAFDGLISLSPDPKIHRNYTSRRTVLYCNKGYAFTFGAMEDRCEDPCMLILRECKITSDGITAFIHEYHLWQHAIVNALS